MIIPPDTRPSLTRARGAPGRSLVSGVAPVRSPPHGCGAAGTPVVVRAAPSAALVLAGSLQAPWLPSFAT